MDTILVAGFATAVAVVLVGALWWKQRSRANTTAHTRSQSLIPMEPEGHLANSIVLGTSADKPALQISMSDDEAAFAQATPLSVGRLDLVGQMSAALQTVPSLLVQQAHQGRHLMEVVINNPLANSAKGDFFLPFARGANGRVIEQAKLLNPSGLSSLVNAAAVWQVASVLVAQKHLADISAKLDEIKQGIDDLKNLIQDKMDGDIEGTYKYLRDVATTFERGEVPRFARMELEASRRHLLQIESGLTRMFNRRIEKTIDHKEIAGTGDLFRDTLRRYDDLDQIRVSLLTCLKAQALAWHVLSLFPGEETSAEIWKEGIMASIAKFAKMKSALANRANEDTKRFQAWLNRESTLEDRKVKIRSRAQRSAQSIEHGTSAFQSGMERAAFMIQHNNDPIRLGIEVVNGRIEQVRALA